MQNRLGLEIKEIIPIRKIPKTTSGKFQRYKLAEMTRNGEFISLKQEI
jgi:polyketide synthase PksJ